MKLYSWNKQTISINDNGKIKAIAPFFLVSDDKAHLFNSNNYTDLGNIFNIEELKNISSSIEMVTDNIKNKIEEKECHLTNMQKKLDNSLDRLEEMQNKIDELESIKNEYIKIINKADEYLKTVQEETDKYMDKLSLFQKQTDEKIKQANFAFNKANVQISDLIDQAENKTAAKYMTVRLNMDNIYNKYVNAISNKADECRKYAEISKKWATNPINMPVENNEYSAYHYATIIKNKGISK